MKRRVYGEELASEPSLFLNEMPLELLEDLSLGKSWLSFRSGSTAIDYEQGEFRKEKKKYTGKTYDSADSIAEFFKQRNRRLGQSSEPKPAASSTPSSSSAEFKPGSYVRHSKYGRGLVLRREGAGESTKLTVSFPGFGQKKLVEKYAGLEKA
jgi:DNA helicase-2/ATP-dependent DNA helicase PcrA